MSPTPRDTSPVPFAPLTLAELNDRGDRVRQECGHVAAAAAQQGFTPFIKDSLIALGAEVLAYQSAAMVRVWRRGVSV